jgi:hypothetical protein
MVMLMGTASAMGFGQFDEANQKGANDSATRDNPFANAVGMIGWRNLAAKENDFDDWIPGDWGYILSNSRTPEQFREGENIIYVGGGQAWGHSSSRLDSVKSLEQWYTDVAKWNNNAGAKVTRQRTYPKLGLEGYGEA